MRKGETAAKMPRLNGVPDYNPAIEGLLAASSTKKKPTVRIKRPGLGTLKGASSISKERKTVAKSILLQSLEC